MAYTESYKIKKNSVRKYHFLSSMGDDSENIKFTVMYIITKDKYLEYEVDTLRNKEVKV